ncbi:AAA family ATPase [Streptococcus uberis]|uniref:AAA family ATPase n=1 Tax=Streptococcus uberis TaxID=1349 RepID=UPI003D6B916A
MSNKSFGDTLLSRNAENLYKVFGEKKITPNNLSELEESKDGFHEQLKSIPRQIIYFGAPGTGKSYQLKEDSNLFLKKNVMRVTFHRSMTYGQFVGVFKPFPDGNSITYKYIPGYLMQLLINALLHPNEAYLLIIEEINRADVSSIFGDFFQLLDRDENHQSIYPIGKSYDFEYFINNELQSNIWGYSDDEVTLIKEKLSDGISLPSNLFIWATMNSADQGVLSMDTAFKRRWEQKYFGINDAYNQNISKFESFAKIKNGEQEDKSWNEIRQRINAKLIALKVPEDKLLGPFYISNHVLDSDTEKLTSSFETKVIMYLFDDVVRHNRSEFFNVESDKMIYSEIVKEFRQKGIEAFKI